ncbi:MAG TPA: nuclear transport factor 2 family protein [Candidatus Dormibacteraeota bacterium]|nr:nuclear transport factor 2 family protein [Candidatus Dormibacteraeota bacterium]
MDLPKPILDAADISSITQLILRERESRDLGRWDRMRDCFWPESLVRVSWYSGNGAGFVDGSIDMARRGILAKHRLGPPLVNLNGERAVATFAAIIDLPAKLQGLEFTLSSHARFLYRAEKRVGTWLLMGFDAIYMRDELTPSLPGQTITVSPEEVKKFRSTYRMLSYFMSSQGYEVNSNLAGEDRPDLVAALNDELYGWAGIKV